MICAGEYRGSLRGLPVYALARLERAAEERLYRRYVADGLRIVQDTLARAWGGLTLRRYADLLSPAPALTPARGEEIARDVLARAGIKVKEYGSI